VFCKSFKSINQSIKKNNEFSNKFARFERATNWKHTQMLGKELDGNNSQSMQIQTEIQNDFQTLIPMECLKQPKLFIGIVDFKILNLNFF